MLRGYNRDSFNACHFFTSGVRSGKTYTAKLIAELEEMKRKISEELQRLEPLDFTALYEALKKSKEALKNAQRRHEEREAEKQQEKEAFSTLAELNKLLLSADYMNVEKNNCGGILAIAEPYKYYAVRNGKRYKVTPKGVFVGGKIERLDVESCDKGVEDKVRLYNVTPERANKILELL